MLVELKQKQIDELLDNDDMRKVVVKESFFVFISVYLADSFELAPAEFHCDMIESLDSVDDVNKYLAILGFRGSAKSTILEVFALWSLLNGKHNFIVYIGNTKDDSKESLANIRALVEENVLLRADFDIHLEDSKSKRFGNHKWSEEQLTLGDCTIIAKSRRDKIRGRKFKKARIDLIIGDDIEDGTDADTAEKRMGTRTWFFKEVLQATKQGVQADNVKVVLLGNKVHKDCLIEHLAKGSIVKVLKFGLFNFGENGLPIIDEDNITWKGLFPTMEMINEKKAEIMLAGEGLGHIIWGREYLLIDVDEEDSVLVQSDIQYYDDEWLQKKPISAGVGVDFAISKKQTADYTAMVKGMDVKNDDGEKRLLIMKNNVKARLGFSETIHKAVEINEYMPHGTKFYPEKVSYQESALEIMKKNGLSVVPMKAVKDKRSRLVSACFYIKSGRVLFPREGAQDVIDNIIGFGIEDHDDLADACAYLILGMVKKGGGILLG